MKWLKITGGVFIAGVALLLVIMAYVEVNQQKILSYFKNELSKNINGELSIEKVGVTIFSHFPNLSVTLENGVIKDSVYKQEVFKVGRIYCRLNLLKLIFKKIDISSVKVEDGNIFLLQDSTGYLNARLFRLKQGRLSQPMDINFDIHEVKINGLKLSFNDIKRNKHISIFAERLSGKVSQLDSSFALDLSGLIHTDSMMFRADRGSFLVNRDAAVNLKLNYNLYLQKLEILPSPVVVDGQQYKMEGSFVFAPAPGYLNLTITDSLVDFKQAKQVLSAQILEKMKDVEVPDPVDVRIVIKGKIDPDLPPEVDASFKLHNGRVRWYGAELTHANLDGLFMNHVDSTQKNDDENSAVIFKIPGANINGVPFNLSLSVTDLKQLHLNASVNINTDLSALNRSIGSDTAVYHFTGGKAELHMNYRGTIYYYLDTIKSNFDDTLAGTLQLKDGVFEYAARAIKLSDMNADIGFSQKSVDLKNMSCAINGNTVKLNGSINSLRRIVSNQADKMTGDLNIESHQFDLSKVLVMKRIFTPAIAPAKLTTNQISKLKATLDSITDRLSLNLHILCDEFDFRKLKATSVKGLVSASSRGMEIKSLNLHVCDGEVAVNGELNTEAKHDRLKVDLKIKNVDVNHFFTAMENFDQAAVKDENINGILNADLKFYAPLEKNYNIIADSIQSKLYFSLTNGRLMNFEPIAKVGSKIFKKRDFRNIAFAEIKDSIIIRGKDIYFKRMEISSSVMRLFVQGKFSFDGMTDLTIQAPLSNLKKADLTELPQNLGADSKGGASIFLRVRGARDSIKITYDPLARQRLKKETMP